MKRSVETEWLDRMPAEDPHAKRSRHDLRRVNFFMGHTAMAVDYLKQLRPFPNRIAEIGAGDGNFLLSIARRLSMGPSEAILVDRIACASKRTLSELDSEGWPSRFVQNDVFQWLQSRPEVDFIIANLFLHHFQDAELERLLALIASLKIPFLALEPARTMTGLAGSALLPFVGCGEVTLHDARLSVRAGFRAGEIATAWPIRTRHRCREEARGLFTHSFSFTP